MNAAAERSGLRLSPVAADARRPLLPREIVLAYRRRRIEHAFAELCVEQGYRGTTIADICRRAGVARNTLYEHFANKEHIFLALLDRSLAELSERVEDGCARAGREPDGRLAGGVGALLAWVAAEPAQAWVCLVESFCATPASLQRYLEGIERFSALLAGAVPGEVSRPPTMEESLVGGLAALLTGLLRSGEAQRAPDLGPQLLTFLRAPFLALPGSAG